MFVDTRDLDMAGDEISVDPPPLIKVVGTKRLGKGNVITLSKITFNVATLTGLLIVRLYFATKIYW